MLELTDTQSTANSSRSLTTMSFRCLSCAETLTPVHCAHTSHVQVRIKMLIIQRSPEVSTPADHMYRHVLSYNAHSFALPASSPALGIPGVNLPSPSALDPPCASSQSSPASTTPVSCRALGPNSRSSASPSCGTTPYPFLRRRRSSIRL